MWGDFNNLFLFPCCVYILITITRKRKFWLHVVMESSVSCFGLSVCISSTTGSTTWFVVIRYDFPSSVGLADRLGTAMGYIGVGNGLDRMVGDFFGIPMNGFGSGW